MACTIGQYGFSLTKMDRTDKCQFDPYLVIELKYWVGGTSPSAAAVSPKIETEEDIDEHVRHLKEDLDAMAGQAKRVLGKARSETRLLVSGCSKAC
jgi:hypothetical protein